MLFTPTAQNRFLDLGLLLRGCRPKSRSLPGRVEVIQPVVRACTTFWLTSTRITLTRVHRQWGHSENALFVTQHVFFLSFYEEDVKIVTAPGLGGCPDMGRWWKMAFLPPENEPLPLRFRSSSAHDLTSKVFPSDVSNCKHFAGSPFRRTDLPPFYPNCLSSILQGTPRRATLSTIFASCSPSSTD